jgi:hypothetical protein
MALNPARLSFCAALALAALAPLAGAQERLQIGGTSITLTAPAGYTRIARGIEDSATGSSITVSERPAESYAELAQTFGSAKNLSAAYAQQGVLIRAVRKLNVGDVEVLFASGNQDYRGKKFVKYLALIKGVKTVLLTFNIADRSFTEADAEALVRSVEIAPPPTLEEQLAQMPFTFRAVEPFRITQVRARTTVTLAAGEESSPEVPVLVIGRAAARALPGQDAQFAVDLLRDTAGFREAVITEEGQAEFAGGTGYRIVATVEDRTVVQYVRIVPGGFYMRLLARGDTAAMQAAAGAIAEIAASVESN